MAVRGIGRRALAVALILAALAPGAMAAAKRAADVPVPSDLLGAAQNDYEIYDDGTFSIWYEGATNDSVRYLEKLLNFCGYAVSDPLADGETTYYVAYNLECDAYAYVGYAPTDAVIELYALDGDAGIIDDSGIERLIVYYMQDIALPAQSGSYVFPQFYASANRAGADYTGMIEGMDSLPFGGGRCWQEIYHDVAPGKIEQYMSDMLLCGFDVKLDFVFFPDNSSDSPDLFLYHFVSGDAELALTYDPGDGSAILYYKPGVSYYLLSGAEYGRAIPARPDASGE